MARLEAMAKMGYYPTPEALTPVIASYLKPKEQGLIRIFDSCAGEGTALKTVGEHLRAETYGIEIDKERGSLAQQNLTRCLITDYKDTQITQKFASLLWLNPPYDWAARKQEIEKSERYERTFLRDAVRYLISSGVLVYLVPLGRLDGTIARMLSYRFEQIRVYRFPENLYRQFRQAVIFGVLKKTPSADDETCEFLRDAGAGKVSVPYLPETPDSTYDVPPSPDIRNFLFRTLEINPEELEEEIRNHGLHYEIRNLISPPAATESITSIMPLRHGHLAQLIACGFIRGIVHDKNRKNPLLVKGSTKKTVDHKVEREGDLERHIETDRIIITIQAINQNGELISIQ